MPGRKAGVQSDPGCPHCQRSPALGQARGCGRGAISGPRARRYSPEAQALQRRCTCCQETRAHEAAVTLQCPDGTAVRHTYTHIDECRCDLACVPSPATAQHGHELIT